MTYLNPWRIHGKELIRLHSALYEALTWKQINSDLFSRASSGYRGCFESALKISSSAIVRSVALEGLKLVERCERLSKGRDDV